MIPTTENSEVLSPNDILEVTEKVEGVWHKVFRAKPEIEFDRESGFTIDHSLELRPETIEITRKTLGGLKTRTIDGWGVYIWQRQAGLPDVPEDIDDIEIGQRQSIDDAIVLLAEVVAKDLAKVALENI